MLPDDQSRTLRSGLVERAGYRGEGIIRVRTDQTNRAYYQDQDRSQHHGVLGNILAVVLKA